MIVYVVALFGCGLLVLLAFVVGLKLGVARSSWKLMAAESVMKSSEAVSRIAAEAASRAARDWRLAEQMSQLETDSRRTETVLATLVAVSDRMDVTLAKVAEWTVMAPGRKRISHQDPVDGFVSRTRSALPSVPLYPEPDEASLAIPSGPIGRERL